MEINYDGELYITVELDIVRAQKIIRNKAGELGFGITDVTRIITATSELARNISKYAGTGVMRYRKISVDSKTGIELLFEDNGPGIPDIDQAMQIGFTTAKGLGMGLPGAKKLMGEMELESEVGRGTKVTVRKWIGKH